MKSETTSIREGTRGAVSVSAGFVKYDIVLSRSNEMTGAKVIAASAATWALCIEVLRLVLLVDGPACIR